MSVESMVELFHKNCINPDILIKIGNTNIYGHRNLLKKFTSFFEISGVCAEIYSVLLPEEKVSPQTFDMIYSWMLMSQKEPAQFRKCKNLMSLYSSAQYLNIPELENCCINALSGDYMLNNKSVVNFYLDAFRTKNEKVKELLLPGVHKYFLNLVSNNFFLNLPFHVISDLLSSSDICVHNELEVFMSGVRWLRGEWESRSSLVTPVMKCVRFGLMTPTQLEDIKQNPDSPEILEITSLNEVSTLIDDGLAYSSQFESFNGDMSQITEACKTMNLEPQVMRNWLSEEKFYQSYKHFLEELGNLDVQEE